jgi:rubrerythrin
MHHEHYLEKWITHHYTDDSSVKYEVFQPSYERNNKTIKCTKYTFETPYTIVKIHVEHPEDDQLDIYVCVSIAIKTPDDDKAQSEKTALSDYLENIRTIVVENNKALNNEYYDELQQECAIEYAMDNC